MWSQKDSEPIVIDVPHVETMTKKLELPFANEDGVTFFDAKLWFNWIHSGARKGKLAFKFWKTDTELLEQQHDSSANSESSKPIVDDAVAKTDKVETRNRFPASAKETVKAAVIHFGKKWHRRLSFIWRHVKQIMRGFQKLWVS